MTKSKEIITAPIHKHIGVYYNHSNTGNQFQKHYTFSANHLDMLDNCPTFVGLKTNYAKNTNIITKEICMKQLYAAPEVQVLDMEVQGPVMGNTTDGIPVPDIPNNTY